MVNEPIVSGLSAVCLVGAAAASPTLIKHINQRVDALIAVDGGADRVLAAGLTPFAVIGALDSISAAARNSFAGQDFAIAAQSTTDFEKALTPACLFPLAAFQST